MKSGRAWDVWLNDVALAQIQPSNADLFFDVNPETTEKHWHRFKVGWTLHDLRRTMATRMGGLGIPPHVISLCIAHRPAGVTGSDAHYLLGDYPSERQAALEAWGAELARVIKP